MFVDDARALFGATNHGVLNHNRKAKMACPCQPTSYNHVVGWFPWVHVRMDGDYASEFVAVNDVRDFKTTYFFRVPFADATFTIQRNTVVVKWKPCDDHTCTTCGDGIMILRPFKCTEEAVLATVNIFNWARDGDGAIYTRVLECMGIDHAWLVSPKKCGGFRLWPRKSSCTRAITEAARWAGHGRRWMRFVLPPRPRRASPRNRLGWWGLRARHP